MKNWVSKNKLYWMGASFGAFAGLLYWKYVGCVTGTCAITSDPVRSSLYFALLGAILFGAFKKEIKIPKAEDGKV